IVWKHDDVTTGGFTSGNNTAPCNSPVTTTASGLVLIGRIVATPSAPNGESMIQAYSDKTGALLWQLPVLVNGKAVAVEAPIPPYSINGKESILPFSNFSTAGPDINAHAL